MEMLAELGLPGLSSCSSSRSSRSSSASAMRIRGPDRVLYAALFAASLTWAAPRRGRLGLGDARHRLLLLRASAGWRSPPSDGRGLGLGAARAAAGSPASRSASAAWCWSSPRRWWRSRRACSTRRCAKFKEGNCGGASQEALDVDPRPLGAARPVPGDRLLRHARRPGRAGGLDAADRGRSRRRRMGILVRARRRPGRRRRGPAARRRRRPTNWPRTNRWPKTGNDLFTPRQPQEMEKAGRIGPPSHQLKLSPWRLREALRARRCAACAI